MILGGNMTHQEPTGFPGVSDEIHSLRWIKNTKERTWGLRPTYVAGSKFPMYSLCWGMVINTIVVGYSRGLYIHSKEFLSKTIYLYEHVYIYIEQGLLSLVHITLLHWGQASQVNLAEKMAWTPKFTVNTMESLLSPIVDPEIFHSTRVHFGLSNPWLNGLGKVTFVWRSRCNLVGGSARFVIYEVFLPKATPQKVILKVLLEGSTCLWNPSFWGWFFVAWTSSLISVGVGKAKESLAIALCFGDAAQNRA